MLTVNRMGYYMNQCTVSYTYLYCK
uniref:Uncharacterized protein n=1 Tax=Arundo donax TaxID=35708 RepID=A0A0A9FRD4_ARUDO